MNGKITLTVTDAEKVDMTVYPAKIIGKNIEKYVGNYNITPSLQQQVPPSYEVQAHHPEAYHQNHHSEDHQ